MKKQFFIILLMTVIILSLIISCSQPTEKHSFKSSGGSTNVNGVTLNKADTTISPNTTEQLVATVLPVTAKNKNITWSSNDPNIALVSSTGLVTAKSLGTVEIIVKTEEGNYTTSCTINVSYSLYETGPAGGIVFYDKSYYSDGWRYLEAAPYDQASNVCWASSEYDYLSNDCLSIGKGETNTYYIISYSSMEFSAALICSNFEFGGYDDWFLPSRDELNEMYNVLKKNGNRGGFTNDHYWSSSEKNDYHNAWYQVFSNGDQPDTSAGKHHTRRARAIRAF